MLILAGLTDALEFRLDDASTAPLPCVAFYRNIDADEYIPSRAAVNSNGATDVAIVSGSAAYSQVIDTVLVFNPNIENETVTVKMVAAGAEFVLTRVTLAQNERLEYQDGLGWSVYASNGAVKTSLNQGTNAAQSGVSVTVLGADVTNNNATLNTLQDITGLSFPVTAGVRYYFNFRIRYTAAATTTGSRFTINGPTFGELTYDSEVPLTSTSLTTNKSQGAYDLPAASNASSPQTTLGNFAQIRGVILPTANGSVVARFASEIASSAIVAKAGSHVEYRAL